MDVRGVIVVPKEAKRYMVKVREECTGWTGRKYYGRPSWTLWMQRAVWEEANGAIPARSTVSETCDTYGCLTVEHLQVTTRVARVPATICRRCGGMLSRDARNKTYCQQCNSMRTRRWRERVQSV